MKVVVTADGANLDAPASPVFGRCPTYVFVDSETMEFEAVENPAMDAASGAGIQAAQFVIEQGAQAVVTGNMGPNAFSVLQSANVPSYLFGGGTVQEAVEAYKAGELQFVSDANVRAGMGGRMGRGMGGGRGMGRGMGLGRGSAAPQPASPGSREGDITTLKELVARLRKQVAEVVDRLDRLEGDE
ncbi:MAG: NifB/NifX family molybdenum-iron cluster-binding protein [Anaerolineae bacterium]|jgi:predicted Fe-Mo cluster-binding NifX family protein